MLLSQDDIQSADLSFDPPMTRMAANRKVHLIAARGAILEGIKYSKHKGLSIPDILLVKNKTETLDSPALEQLISPMTRDVLAIRIREELSKGVPLGHGSEKSAIKGAPISKTKNGSGFFSMTEVQQMR